MFKGFGELRHLYPLLIRGYSLSEARTIAERERAERKAQAEFQLKFDERQRQTAGHLLDLEHDVTFRTNPGNCVRHLLNEIAYLRARVGHLEKQSPSRSEGA